MTTRVPKGKSASEIRASSVATMTSRTLAQRRTRSTTCWTSGMPVSEARILAGKRVDPKRAGITTVAAKVEPLFDGPKVNFKLLGKDNATIELCQTLPEFAAGWPSTGNPKPEYGKSQIPSTKSQ